MYGLEEVRHVVGSGRLHLDAVEAAGENVHDEQYAQYQPSDLEGGDTKVHDAEVPGNPAQP